MVSLLQQCTTAIHSGDTYARVGDVGDVTRPAHNRLLLEGASLFNDSMKQLVESLAPTQIIKLNHKRSMLLASFVGDKTLSRFRGEVRGDAYRLRKIPCIHTGLFIDVGSNIGDTAISAALQLPCARIVAVEAVPHLAWLVRYNLLLNNITEVACDALAGHVSTSAAVCVLNRAVTADGKGRVRISYRVSDSPGGNRLEQDKSWTQLCTRSDGELTHSSRISLISM